MAESFYTILTTLGKSKLANSIVLGNEVNLKTLQVGDGNGTYHEPSENQTSLINKVWEADISSISVDELNSNWIMIQTIIPATDGGFYIREAGIFDEDGDLIAVSKVSETYKPVISEGSSKDIVIKIMLEVSNADNITLKIDPSVTVATKNDIEILETKIQSVNTQLSDLVGQTAKGTATAITLPMQTLVDGYFKTFIASTDNNSEATTINGKPLYKPNTVAAPNLIAGKAYTVWYNSDKDCFFIKASAEGNTIAAHVLAGDTFSNDDDTGLVGTLDLSNLISKNVKSGVTINGVSGKSSVVDTADATAVANHILSGETAYKNGEKITGTATAKAAATITPGTTDQAIAANQYLTEVQTIKGDANLLAANIISGKSIFGVVGSYNPLKLVAGTDITLYENASPITTYSATYVIAKSATNLNTGGTVTVTFDLEATGSYTNGAYGRIYVNNVPVGTERYIPTGTNYTAFTENVTVNTGDVIQIYIRCGTGTQAIASKEFKISCGNSYGRFA